MNLYLVTIHAECAMYEEQVRAASKQSAINTTLTNLIEEGEIEEDDTFIRTYVEVLEEDV